MSDEKKSNHVSVSSQGPINLDRGSIIGNENKSKYVSNSSQGIDLEKLSVELRRLYSELVLLAEENKDGDYTLACNEIGEIYRAVKEGHQPDKLKQLSDSSKKILSTLAHEFGLPIILDLIKNFFLPNSS